MIIKIRQIIKICQHRQPRQADFTKAEIFFLSAFLKLISNSPK